MKPRLLTMTAFGPFLNPMELDFRALGGADFFLIHGPTGAGKSTILDAMCYALFGSTSGAERTAAQMRHQQAPPTLRTEVVFEFTVRDRAFRITRSPSQTVAGRGGRETSAAETVSFVELLPAGGERLIAAKQRETVGAVEELLGFSDDQFRQIVMLPQGRFRELLTAGSEKREEILRALFGTDRFARIAEALQRRATALDAELRTHQSKEAGLLQATGYPTREQLAKALSDLGGQLLELNERSRSATRRHNECMAVLHAAEKIETSFVELGSALAAIAELTASQAVSTRQRADLERARTAEHLAAEEGQILAREHDISAMERKATASEVESKDAGIRHEGARASLAAALAEEPRLALLRDEITDCDRLALEVARLDESRVAAAAAEKKARAAANLLDQARGAVAMLEASLRALREELTETSQIASRVGDLRAEAELAGRIEGLDTELATAKKSLAVATQKFTSAERSRQTAKAAFDAARAEHYAARRAWDEGQAVLLAARLGDGNPCPVCGSVHHPHPAHAQVAPPSQAELDESTQLLDEREAASNEALSLEASAREEQSVARMLHDDLSRRRAAVSESPRPSPLIREELAAALKAAAQAEAGSRKLAQGETKLTAARAHLDDALAMLQPLLAEQQRTAAIVTEQSARIPAALRASSAISQKRATAADTSNRIQETIARAWTAVESAADMLKRTGTAHAAAVARVEEARRELDARRSQWRERRVAAGLGDDTTWAAARTLVARIVELAESVRVREAAESAAKDRLHRAERATKDLTRPDVTRLAADRDAAAMEDRSAAQALTVAQERRDRLAPILGSLEELEARISEIAEQTVRTRQLADVASGRLSGSDKIGFHRFVLGTLLDEVLEAATLRLRRMSRGRYILRRALATSDGRSRAGLDLEVDDTQTGHSRDVRTLSGGEGFLASLSLALGLADVVRARAGGVELGLLLIDEGFGTLDDEALELAINTLLELREGDRLVGVISHLNELRQRIAARLEVTPGNNGSTARFVMP